MSHAPPVQRKRAAERSLASRLLSSKAIRSAVVTLGLLGTASLASADSGLSGNAQKADKARDLVLELSTKEAHAELDGVDTQDQILAVERARLALYEGDCVLAAGILARSDLEGSNAAAQLGAISRGCVRSTAGALTIEDADKGVILRFQDDEDAVLAPLLGDVAQKARELFKHDLGVELPRPIRIEIVRDQWALAAMTGLPVEAARTTGTIAIAKWGRVVMVSPRAAMRGYSFMDTLAHELSHLAQTRGSRDRAPLWLQEGVARIEETRWRLPRPFDDFPSADDVAAFGIQNHIGPDIDKIGPSIAMLPSAEEAMITYAKVMSFIRYWSRTQGDEALPKLLAKMGQANDADEVMKSLEAVSGTDFSTWSERWQKEGLAGAKELPEDLRPGAPPPKALGEVRKRVRLGQLFDERKHHTAGKKEFERAFELAPHEAAIRAGLAHALLALGETERARAVVEKSDDVRANDARWWSMHGLLVPTDADSAWSIALSLDPYDPGVACREKPAPATPDDPAQKALCEAARRKPR